MLLDWLEWCEQVHAAAEAPHSGEGESELWRLLLDRRECLGSVYVSRLGAAEPWLLEALDDAGCLRAFPEGPAPRGNLLWFVRGVETRVALPTGALDEEALASSRAPWILLGGPSADLPPGLASAIGALRAEGRRLAAGELDALLAQDKRGPVYCREVRSVRECLATDALRGATDFFELEEHAQEVALWSALLGEGTLDLEQAIRLCAQRLRAQGWLEFQHLRTAGEIYQTIHARLLSARRRGLDFDRPRQGHIRAISADLDQLKAEEWRDCVMGALANERRIDRNHALRLAFEYAQEVYGVAMQRLRGGGRAERALKSAINSAIRQGYLQRDGALYLLRVAEPGEPVVRGAEDSQREAPVTTESDEHPPATQLSSAPAASTELAPSAPAEPTAPLAQPSGLPGSTLPVTEPADAPAPAETETETELLHRRLLDLEFPTRTLNWAARKGIVTVGELVAIDPELFAQERNVGRLTVRQTRAALEEALGRTWEQARSSSRGGSIPADDGSEDDAPASLDEDAITSGGAVGWSACAATLGERLRDVPIGDIELPTRMRTFVAEQGIATVGELLSHGYEDLRSRPNLGRKSLNDSLDAIQDYIEQQAAPLQHATFLDAWRAQVTNLKPVHRLILSRRIGMHGSRETLEEIGGMLGLTRERVRQIEARVVERLQQKSRLRGAVVRHLNVAFGGARALPLALLAEESWWQGIQDNERLLTYVLHNVLDDELRLFAAPSGASYVLRFAPELFDAAVQSAEARVARLEFPVPYASVLAILEDECSRLDPCLVDEMELVVRELLHFDELDPERVNGHGRFREAEVLALLNAQPAPVPVALLEEKVGRGALPAEVLYFKRGVVGLKKHFPDFDEWLEKLVPAAIEVMNGLPAGRQWLVPEIHEELQGRELLPDWLGHWHLASLLRLSGAVEYLGRLRVALPGSGQQERLRFEDVFVELLEDAGAPLPFAEVLRRALEKTDVREETAKMLLNQAPFVRVDEEHVGLVERDIPGGAEAVATAVDAITAQLEASGRGLTPHQATLLVQGLSELHRGWSRELVVSVLRSEPSLRIDRSRNIGLDGWDDARCPARAEFVRREVARSGGLLALSVLQDRMAELYGRAPDRVQLQAFAAELGFVVQGEVMVRPAPSPDLPSVTPAAAPPAAAAPPSATATPASTPAAPIQTALAATQLAATTPTPTTPAPADLDAGAGPPSTSFPPSARPTRALQGIPAELRETIDELAQEPLSEREELRRQVDAHVGRFFAEYRVSEFVDLEGARRLREQSEQLLERWDTLTPGERQLAHAAIRYFVIPENLESDFDIGGLDDDKRVMAAVLEHLGISAERHAEA